MWTRLGVIIAIATGACYAPSVLPGAPCSLELDNCPRGQRCELVAGEYLCVLPGSSTSDANGADSIAGTDADVVDGDVDAAPGVDAAIDAMPIDAMPIDAMPIDAMPQTMWTLVQTRGEQGTDVNFSATAAGNAIVVGIETNATGAVTSVTDNVGNTYVSATGSRSKSTQGGFGVEVWYALNATAGAIRIVPNAPTVYGVVMWEVRGLSTRGNVSKVDDQAGSTTPDGAPITTTTTGEFVVSIVIVDTVVSGIVPGNFTNDHNVFGNGWAHLTSRTAPPSTYTAEWNQGANAVSCASSAAFRQ